MVNIFAYRPAVAPQNRVMAEMQTPATNARSSPYSTAVAPRRVSPSYETTATYARIARSLMVFPPSGPLRERTLRSTSHRSPGASGRRMNDLSLARVDGLSEGCLLYTSDAADE